MKPTVCINQIAMVKNLYELGFTDFIISSYSFSKTGDLSLAVCAELIAEIRMYNLEPIFDWDCLLTQAEFDQKVKDFKRFHGQNHLKRIRVQDFGVARFLKENYPEIKLHLNLEQGHRNRLTIRNWTDYFGAQCERVVLSSELTREQLLEIRKNLSVPCELLTLGRILLFYSPRPLLASFFQRNSDQEAVIEAQACSEESPHKGFLLHENPLASLMYHPKDQCLLDRLPQLDEIAIDYGRIDLRHIESTAQLWQLLSQIIFDQQEDIYPDFLKHYPREVLRGFFQANKTDVIFKRLKNQRLVPKNPNYLGRVMDSLSKKSFAFLLEANRSISAPCQLEIHQPQGKVNILKVDKILNSSRQQITCAHPLSLVVIPCHLTLAAQSRVYLVEDFNDS